MELGRIGHRPGDPAIDVGGHPLAEAFQPRLRMRQLPHAPMSARFALVNPLGQSSDGPYTWSFRAVRTGGKPSIGFGGEQIAALGVHVTPWPHAVLHFGPHVDPHSPYTTFAVTVDHASLSQPLVHGVRAWSTYHRIKQMGTLRLPVVKQDPPLAAKHTMRLSFTVRNHEDEAVHLSAQHLQWLFLDDEGKSEIEAAMSIGVVVPANATAELTATVAGVPEGASALAVHAIGASDSGMPARTSAYFDVPAGWRPERHPAPVTGHEWDDPRLWRILDGRRIIDTGDLWEMDAPAFEAITRTVQPETYVVRSGDLPPAPGVTCDPEVDGATEDLVCAATGDTAMQTLPGRILNARKGDVLLFAGVAESPIAAMAQALEPAQRFSHCGLMVRDHAEVRHCTASGDWLLARVEKSLDPHIPEEHVRFVWPGTLTMTADEMAHGSMRESPEGEKHKIGTWHLESSFELVEPLVVKPPVEEEVEHAWVRPLLNQVAEEGKLIQGHYRWVCHSRGDFSDPTTPPGWAADAPEPSMCSVFVWRSAARAGVRFEGDGAVLDAGDLEDEDIDAGAVVAATTAPPPDGTRDGFYLYDPGERLDAGKALQAFFVEKAIEGAPGFAEGFAEDVATRISNQIINALGNDDGSPESANPPEGEDPPWKQNVQPANTVFPEDILFWDPPSLGGAYGDAEPIVYRPPRLVDAPVYEWTPRTGPGTVTGMVTDDGAGVAHADVWVNGTFRTFADAEGRYSVSLGANTTGVMHVLWARKDKRSGPGQGTHVTVVTGETQTVDLELDGVPPDRRTVIVEGQIEICDSEPEFGPVDMHLDAANPTESRKVIDNGEGTYAWLVIPIVIVGLLRADVTVKSELVVPDTGEVDVTVVVKYRYLTPPWGAGTHSGKLNLTAGDTDNRVFAFSTWEGDHDLKVTLKAKNQQSNA